MYNKFANISHKQMALPNFKIKFQKIATNLTNPNSTNSPINTSKIKSPKLLLQENRKINKNVIVMDTKHKQKIFKGKTLHQREQKDNFLTKSFLV